MKAPKYGWRVELWWQVESLCGWIWARVTPADQVEGPRWLERLDNWASARRYEAERRRNPHLFR